MCAAARTIGLRRGSTACALGSMAASAFVEIGSTSGFVTAAARVARGVADCLGGSLALARSVVTAGSSPREVVPLAFSTVGSALASACRDPRFFAFFSRLLCRWMCEGDCRNVVPLGDASAWCGARRGTGTDVPSPGVSVPEDGASDASAAPAVSGDKSTAAIPTNRPRIDSTAFGSIGSSSKRSVRVCPTQGHLRLHGPT